MLTRGINHVVLKVRSLDASERFYVGILGLVRVGERPGMAFYGAGGHVHDLALMEIGPQAVAPVPHATGLAHLCFDVADETALASLYARCRDAGLRVSGGVDHTVMRSFYLLDPDGHMLELGVDRPRDAWAATADPFGRDEPYALMPSARGRAP